MSRFPERRVVWVLLLLGGCFFDEGGLPADGDGGTSPDAAQFDADVNAPDADVNAPDADVNAPDALVTDGAPVDSACIGDPLGFSPSNFSRCDLVGPNAAPGFGLPGTWTFDSDDGTLSPPGGEGTALEFAIVPQPGGPQLMVVAFADFDLPAGVTLDLTGARPVALVSLTSIDVSGTLSVGAVGTNSGPGGDLGSVCESSGRGANGVAENTGLDQNNVELAGQGGGGGGFGGVGGLGGPVVTTQPAGGPIGGNTTLVPLRGGCRGGSGGHTGGGAGGGAGGGLQLVAAGTITVTATGRVTARGGGGHGSTAAASAGGGGGSGGGLLFEAKTSIAVNSNGAVTANGGGGGEGTRTGNDGGEGGNGHDADGSPAAGGTSPSTGGNGGPGGAEAAAAGPGVKGASADNFPAGGGGGGGGVGRIHFRAGSVNVSGVVSPDPQ